MNDQANSPTARDFADALLRARNLRGRDVFLMRPPE